jgi:ribose transport system ATP-binding protein
MDDPILQFLGIDKAFFGVSVLNEVSLDVGRGHILGLVGENGAGKSTLMNILGGVVPLDSGRMVLDGAAYEPRDPGDADRAGIAFIHQELNLFTNLSIAENFFISDFPRRPGVPVLDRGRIKAKAREYLALVDLPVSPDIPVERLTPGERQLVEVAKALSVDARVIIFDEPTTSLTARETERLFDIISRLHADGRTIIYISHILRDVLRLSDAIAVLRDGALVAHGPRSEFTIHSMIASMVGRDIEDLYPERTSRPGEEVALEVRQLSKSGIVHEIDLCLHKSELLGVFGLMGSGRSELAQIIFGLEDADRGEVLINGQVTRRLSPPRCIKDSMAFVTENRREEGLMMTATVADNLGLAALPEYSTRLINVVKRGTLATAVRGSVDMLRIKVNDAFRNQAKGLSGGNQQKVVLGKWLLTRPSILIIDEPTRGVDVGAKFELYTIIDRIASEGTAVLFISSEIEELIGMCDRIIVMGHGEVLGSFTRAEFDTEQILRTAFRETEA